MRYSRSELLSGLLSILWFLRIQHQQIHWMAKGPNYYGDHLLFQRLYEEVDEDIDELAEKILGLDGPCPSMHGTKGALRVAAQFERFSLIPDLPSRALVSERMALKAIERVYDYLGDCGALTLGLDDYLQALANKHEKHLYLLQQRVGENVLPKGSGGYC